MKNQPLTQELVKGVQKYSFMKYIGLLPNPDKVLSYAGRSYETLRDLKNDPHVYSCIQSRKSGILRTKWQIIGCSPQREQIQNIFEQIDLNELVSYIFEAILFGFQPIEIIWEQTESDLFRIIPKKFILLPQEYFIFSVDGKLKLRDGTSKDPYELPDGKIICPQYEASLQNPYGTALLSKCYWACTFKNGAFRFWVNFMERYGMPMLLGQYKRGATEQEIERLADSLINMAENTVIVAPDDIEIKLAEPTRSSSYELYYELIRTCNAEISKALLSQTLTTELDSGSYAASQTHYSIRKEVIHSDLRFVSAQLQKIIELIYEINNVTKDGTKFNYVLDQEPPQQELSD